LPGARIFFAPQNLYRVFERIETMNVLLWLILTYPLLCWTDFPPIQQVLLLSKV